jgi:flagellar biosynthesis/type III secretory pathway protein FliH
MQNLTQIAQDIERHVKQKLRATDVEALPREVRHDVRQLKLACNEVRLDVRDYEYAETRADQEKWAKLGRHNLKALNVLLLRLDTVFGPADVAELGARLEELKSSLR